MTISFDRIADIYDRTREFPKNVMTKIIEFLKNELIDQELILDVGVGTGRFAGPLQQLGLKIVGIDISEKMLTKAKERNIKNLTLGDARYLPFRDSAFYATITVHILHLIKDWKLALKEIVRVTKGDLVTVMRWRENYYETPGGAYMELVKKLGYSYAHPGVGEWELEELIKPIEKRFIATYKSDVRKSIEFLDGRVFSFQWKMSDDIHEKAMKEIRQSFADKPEYSNDIYLVKWSTSDIGKLLIQSKAKDLPR